MNLSASTPERVADAFVGVLKEWLTAGEIAEVRRRNYVYDESACASQDFCDANMAMHEALEREGVLEDEDDAIAHLDEVTPLWNAAWSAAKAKDLTASAEEALAVSGCGYCGGALDDDNLWVCTREGCRHCGEFAFCSSDHADAYHATA